MKVIVIGAGLAGLTAAWWLARAGMQVALFERADGPGRETSSRNGSLQHPSHAEPWNSPGVFRELLHGFGNERSAMLLRPSALPSLIGWGLRFLRESSPRRFEANARANLALARYSLQCMAEIRAATGIDAGHRRGGTLVTFRDAAALAAARRWAQALEAHGLEHHALDPAQAAALEPALQPVAGELVGALHYPGDERGDPQQFCIGLTQALAAQGAALHFGTAVARIDAAGGSVRGVVDAAGSHHAADAVVLAAASASVALARPLGLALPVRPVKGYSITLPARDGAPRLAVIDPALHMAVVPVGDDRLRVAGTAEFCGFDLTIQPERVANLRRLFEQLYPRLAAALAPADVEPWTGLRPMCADGKCLTGATRVRGLFLHTGHGQLGWTVCAGSSRLLSALMLGAKPAIDAAPFAPARFGLA